jgi:hypothetical protein
VHRSAFLRDLAAEGLKGDRVRLGAPAYARVEGVDGGQFVRGEVEAEDVEVLGDPARFGRLRDRGAPLLPTAQTRQRRRLTLALIWANCLENTVMSCDLQILVYETTEAISSQRPNGR